MMRSLSRAARPAWLTLFAVAGLAAGLGGCRHAYDAGDESTGAQGAASRVLGAIPSSERFQTFRGPGARGQFQYPLAVGNRWEYITRVRTVLVVDGVPEPPQDFESSWVAQITSTAVVDSREYFLQEEFDPRIAGPSVAIATFLRQDGTGLFVKDTPFLRPARGPQLGPQPALARGLISYVNDRPAAAAHIDAFRNAARLLAARVAAIPGAAGMGGLGTTGADPGEITFLRYPLFAGAQWIVRDSPSFARTVEGRETVEVPGGQVRAWRIRGSSELFGPQDRVAFCYGDPGLVRVRVHAELDAVDTSGTVVGRVVLDTDQRLTAVTLVDSEGPHALR